MRNSEGSFVIKRSWKFLASVAMIGFVIAAFGECFLYCNSIAADSFCKWCGIIATVTGAAMICWPVSHITAPLLKADYVGIWFDIAVSGNGVFIPWDEIANIKVEDFGMLSFKWKTTTPCLVFEINDSFSKRIPALLKSAYYRSNSRLYFASGILSVPVDEALRRLLSFQKGGV